MLGPHWAFKWGERRILNVNGHRRKVLGCPEIRALAALQSDIFSVLLTASLSGITGNKIELMLMAYDMNSF